MHKGFQTYLGICWPKSSNSILFRAAKFTVYSIRLLAHSSALLSAPEYAAKHSGTKNRSAVLWHRLVHFFISLFVYSVFYVMHNYIIFANIWHIIKEKVRWGALFVWFLRLNWYFFVYLQRNLERGTNNYEALTYPNHHLEIYNEPTFPKERLRLCAGVSAGNVGLWWTWICVDNVRASSL